MHKYIASLLKYYEQSVFEKCHQKFVRFVLGVHKKTTLDAIYGDTLCPLVLWLVLLNIGLACVSLNQVFYYIIPFKKILFCQNGLVAYYVVLHILILFLNAWELGRAKILTLYTLNRSLSDIILILLKDITMTQTGLFTNLKT